METKKKTTNERIAELKTRLINSKDVRQSEKLLNQLLALHRSTFEMNRLLDIPLSEVKESIDFGANVLHRTIRGYAWECKGGMITFVEHRMARVCTMLNALFELHNKEDKTEDDNIVYENFQTAIEYCFQAPIFASLEETSLFEIATAILKTFNDYAVENYVNAEAVDETAQDVRDNIESENMARGLEALANTPLPPED